MLRFLKVMYHFGYLPFHWINGEDAEADNPVFKISRAKSILGPML